MFYRVVMQGCTLGGADLEEVKRQFVRVTGLSLGAAEQMFCGIPQVVKRQVAQTDAERIAATLRAIGAAATVEREVLGADEESPEGVQITATPLHHGPPTVIPGMEPSSESTPNPSGKSRLSRTLRTKWPMLLGATLLVAAVILVVIFADEFLVDAPAAPQPARPASARAAQPEVAPSTPAINVSLLLGPWRCTDQQTGVSAYWSYAANGGLVFYGDVLSDRPPPAAVVANRPTEWVLDGPRLSHKYAQRAPDTYKISSLSLPRLRYGDGRKIEIECRRP